MTTTDATLYRALNKSDFPDSVALIVDDVPVDGVLYPQFTEKRWRSRGQWRTRAPDVTITADGDQSYVQTGGGTSLFDKEYVFGSQYWRSFTIPKGTEIPDSLKIEKGGYNAPLGATHYQIEVRTGRMEIGAFKGALDNLARNAVVKLVEASKGKEEKKEEAKQ